MELQQAVNVQILYAIVYIYRYIVCDCLQAVGVQILYATVCKLQVYRYCMQLLASCELKRKQCT